MIQLSIVDCSDSLNSFGVPNQPKELNAVVKAMKAFMSANSGDYIRKRDIPTGFLRRYEFINQNLDLNAESRFVQDNLNTAFGALVSINNVELSYIQRILVIKVTVTSLRTGETTTFERGLKQKFKYQNEVTYIPVPFDGQDLVDFIQGELSLQPKSTLTYNSKLKVYVWAKYRLDKLTQDSDEFLYIVELISQYNEGT